jgi:hypothetical protein
MADNVGYTPGTGALVAADEIAGVLHQRIKIGVGVDGVAVDVSSANPMPVTLPDVTALNPLLVSDVTNAAAQQDMILLLTRMLNYLNAPQGYDKSQQRQRNTTVIENGTITTVSTVTNVGTVGTVGTVTNQTQMGGIQAQILVNAGNLAAWNAVVRSRIT